MALSGRLQIIYENLVAGGPVWDFCCDHGYLGIEALKSQRFQEVYFVDRVPHIVEEVEKRILEKFPQFHSQARFKISKGEELEEPVTGSVVIAGVGAFAIFKILESLWQRRHLQADRLILCPQRDEKKLLEMLESLGPEFTQSFSLSLSQRMVESDRQRVVYVMDHFSNRLGKQNSLI